MMKSLCTLLMTACLAAGVTVTSAFAQPNPLPAPNSATSRVGLLVRLDARKGMENEVMRLLLNAKSIVDAEPATTTWYAIRLSPTSFGIFDTFAGDAGRDAHLTGGVPSALNALLAKFPDLLERPPSIEKVDVLTFKPSASVLNKN
jgi:quinol monooxygenase YgiN